MNATMTNLFSDGFESGTLLKSDNPAGAWDGITAGCSVETNNPHHGTHNAKLVGSSDYVYAWANLTSSTPTGYIRAYVKLTSLPVNNGDYVGLLGFEQAGDGSGQSFAAIRKTSGVQYWAIQGRNGASYSIWDSSTTPTAGTYYCVELYAYVHNSAGVYTLWINGVQVLSVTGLDTDNFGNLGAAVIGCSVIPTAAAYFDCVVTSDSYIGPENTSGTDLTVTGNLTVDENATVNNALSADTLSTTGNATVGAQLSANSASISANLLLGGDLKDAGNNALVLPLANMPRGTSGYVLTAQGTGSPPTWAAPSGSGVDWASRSGNNVTPTNPYYTLGSVSSPWGAVVTLAAQADSYKNKAGTTEYISSIGSLRIPQAEWLSNPKTWNNPGDGYGGFELYTVANDGYRRYLDIVADGAKDGVSGGGTIRFLTNPNNDDTAVERMRIDRDGTVNISNALSVNTLSTTGNATVGNALSANSLSAYSLPMLGNGTVYTNNLSPIAPQTNVSLTGNFSATNITSNNQLTAGATTLSGLTVTGNITIADSLSAGGGIVTGSGARIERSADHVTISNPVLPTEGQQYKTYTDIGHGNVLFKHTGLPDQYHQYPPIDQGEHWGRYANIYLVMLQDPGDSTVYQPMIAMDRGLWVEKDVQAYGAFFTHSDPGKHAGGGAILIGHGLTKDPNDKNDDPPRITLTDSAYVEDQYSKGNFDALYITKANLEPHTKRSNIVDNRLGGLVAGTIMIGSPTPNIILANAENAGIEIGNSTLSGTTPYIDFHYGLSSAEDFNVRLINSSNQCLYIQTSLDTGGFFPTHDDVLALGSTSNRWRHIYGNWIHAYTSFGSNNTTIQSYDSLDDLRVIKSVKSKKHTVNGVERDVIDFANLEFLHHEAFSNSVDLNKMIGFLFGVGKYAAIEIDTLKQEFKYLRDQLDRITAEGGVA